MKKKTDSVLVETIIKLKKTNPEMAKMLAKPKRLWVSMNLGEIEEKTKEGEKVIIPGKVLSSGSLSKKIEIIAWGVSEKAVEKIKESESSFKEIVGEVKSNPELKGLTVLK